jgi:hypothetical protein
VESPVLRRAPAYVALSVMLFIIWLGFVIDRTIQVSVGIALHANGHGRHHRGI